MIPIWVLFDLLSNLLGLWETFSWDSPSFYVFSSSHQQFVWRGRTRRGCKTDSSKDRPFVWPLLKNEKIGRWGSRAVGYQPRLQHEGRSNLFLRILGFRGKFFFLVFSVYSRIKVNSKCFIINLMLGKSWTLVTNLTYTPSLHLTPYLLHRSGDSRRLGRTT